MKLLLSVLLVMFMAACSDKNETVGPINGQTNTGTAANNGGQGGHTPESNMNEQTPQTEEPATDSDPAELDPAAIALETVLEPGSVERPVGLVARTEAPDLVYIIEQAGRIVSLNLQRPMDEPVVVLDITDRVNDEGNEQGLLGLAFDPAKPEYAYVNYTFGKQTVISRFAFAADKSGMLLKDSEHIFLTFDQPYENHNGGQLAFGPEGYLYIATGDGGSGGDPQNNSQNLKSLLGKILRIDVNRKQGNQLYTIPPDNPFIGKGRGEIYAYGLRNPWRFSFDSATGELWAADVGQNRYEEIDLIRKGGNYGWKVREGLDCFEPEEGCAAAGFIDPIHTYDRDSGVSITGGLVYRGEQIPAMNGWYIYADYGLGTIWALKQLPDGSVDNRILFEQISTITSFGVDASGELYACLQDGTIQRFSSKK